MYEKLLGLQERLQLKLDHHWSTIGLVKKNSEKEEMKKIVSSCIMEKFKGIDIKDEPFREIKLAELNNRRNKSLEAAEAFDQKTKTKTKNAKK